jgi:hypothetical protein
MAPMAILVGHKAVPWGRKPIFLAGMLPIRGILYTLTQNPYALISIQILDGIGVGIFSALFSIVEHSPSRWPVHTWPPWRFRQAGQRLRIGASNCGVRINRGSPNEGEHEANGSRDTDYSVLVPQASGTIANLRIALGAENHQLIFSCER